MWPCIVCGRTTKNFFEVGGWSTGKTVDGVRSVHCGDTCRRVTAEKLKKGGKTK